MNEQKSEAVSPSLPTEGEVPVTKVLYEPDYTATYGIEGHLNRIRAEKAQSQDKIGEEL